MIRLGAVGDVVRTLPAVAALRARLPGAHVAWLVEPAAADAVRGRDFVDEVLVFPRPRLAALLRGCALAALGRELGALRRELRGRRFDLVLDFHSILRSGLLALLTGAPRRVAYARPFGRELAWLCATDRVRLAERRVSRFTRNAALVEYLGLPPPRRDAGGLAVGPTQRAAMRLRLGPGPFAAIHPGTSPATPHKRYPIEAYARFARALAAQHGLVSLVTRGASRAERDAAERLVALAPGAARLAPETRSLGELAALFAACRLVVGSDSGPLHLAAVAGTPVVQILGPTDPVENAPYPATPSRQVRVPLPCSPCRRGCAPAPCMRAVPPASLLRAARELLAATRPVAPARAGAVA